MMNKNVIGGLITVLVLVMMISVFSVGVYAAAGTPKFGPNLTLGNINDSDKDGNIEISWNNTNIATRYYVLRSETGNITNVSTPGNLSVLTNRTQKVVGDVGEVGTETFFEDNTSIHGVRYYYAIVPVNSSGGINNTHGTLVLGANITHPFVAGGTFRSVNHTSDDQILPRWNANRNFPLTVTVNNHSSLNISWDPIALDMRGNVETNITFLIFRSTTASSAMNITNKSLQIANNTGVSYQDNFLNESTFYYYAVGTYDDAGNYNNGSSNATLNTSRLTSWSSFIINNMPAHGNSSGYSVVYDNSSQLVYYFAGYLGAASKYTREFYAINISNMSLHANLTNTTPGVTASAGPTARNHGGMVFDYKNNTFYYWGGYNGTYLGELWAYNASRERVWNNVTWGSSATFGPAAVGMIYPRMFYRWNGTNGTIYAVGGFNQSVRTSNGTFFKYDTHSRNWSSEVPSLQCCGTDAPVHNITNRYGQSAVYIPHNTSYRPDDLFFMFGGKETSHMASALVTYQWTNHTFIYNLTSGNWTQYFMHKGIAPTPRDFADAIYDVHSDAIKLIGGRNGTSNDTDLRHTWIFNLTTKTWNRTNYRLLNHISFGGGTTLGGSNVQWSSETSPRLSGLATYISETSNAAKIYINADPLRINPLTLNLKLAWEWSDATTTGNPTNSVVTTPSAGLGGAGTVSGSAVDDPLNPGYVDSGLGIKGSTSYTDSKSNDKLDPKVGHTVDTEAKTADTWSFLPDYAPPKTSGAGDKFKAAVSGVFGAPVAISTEVLESIELEEECDDKSKFRYEPIDCKEHPGKVVDVSFRDSCDEIHKDGARVQCSDGGWFWEFLQWIIDLFGLDKGSGDTISSEGVDTSSGTDSGTGEGSVADLG